jgi:hypothetical protein
MKGLNKKIKNLDSAKGIALLKKECKKDPINTHYRMYHTLSGHSHVKIVVDKYKVIKETICGFWIKPADPWVTYFKDGAEKKWISKNSTRRFAYPTIDEAKTSYMARCNSHLKILKSRLVIVEAAVKAINDEDLMAIYHVPGCNSYFEEY